MICPDCSAVLPEDSAFCHKCGAQVTRPVTSSPGTPPNQPASTGDKVKTIYGFTKEQRDIELARIRKKFEGRGWIFVAYQDELFGGKAYFNVPPSVLKHRRIRNWLIGISLATLFIFLANYEGNESKTSPKQSTQSDRQSLPRPSQGDYIIVNDLSIGCISQQTFDEMTKYAVQNDKPAIAQMIVAGACEILEKGTPVFAGGLGSLGVSIVRPVGQRKKFYVSMNDIEKISR